jgi:ATP-binding cassette subfamily B (MDR/TAP) protein 1
MTLIKVVWYDIYSFYKYRIFIKHIYLQLIDDIDIQSLNVHWWRSQLALVNQDPVLFDGTIRENILFGCQYRSEPLPNMEHIIEAAKTAHIHDFICSLPKA